MMLEEEVQLRDDVDLLLCAVAYRDALLAWERTNQNKHPTVWGKAPAMPSVEQAREHLKQFAATISKGAP